MKEEYLTKGDQDWYKKRKEQKQKDNLLAIGIILVLALLFGTIGFFVSQWLTEDTPTQQVTQPATEEVVTPPAQPKPSSRFNR